jgi:hypothetical protein
MKKWEYRLEAYYFDDRNNEIFASLQWYGEKGFEAFAVDTYELNGNRYLRYHFKRPIEENKEYKEQIYKDCPLFEKIKNCGDCKRCEEE